jgi:hypothetical protein
MPAGATYEPIATTTLGSNQTSVTFSSLGSYTDIIAIVTITTDSAGSLFLRFNGDTATNYSHARMGGNGSTATSGKGTSATRMQIGYHSTGTNPTNPGVSKVHLFNYGGSTFKSVLCETAGDNNGSGDVSRYVGLWRSTAAVTSVTFDVGGTINFKTGSTFTLYGIARA